MPSMDAKEIKHPCEECTRQDKNFCSYNKCLRYLSWFGAKWQEVTEPIKREVNYFE